MKKILLNSFQFKASLAVTMLLYTGTLFAQTTINTGETVAASTIPTNTAVVINAGGTLDMDLAKSFSSLVSANTGTSAISGIGALSLTTLSVAGGNTLSIAAPVTVATLTTANLNNQTATLSGTGNVNATTLSINGTNGNPASFVIGSDLTVQVVGGISGGSGNNSSTYNLTVNGILKISGAVDVSGPGSIDNFICNTGSIVEYNGAAQTIFATNYYSLVLSGSGIKQLVNAGGAATFSFGGDITIGAGTTLDNNNKILSVVGNWANNGAFTQGPGAVIFSGNAPQSIGGTQATTFANVTFANTNGGVSLTKPVTVTGIATFTNGVVTSDATNILIFNDNAISSLTEANAGTTSYVSGPVRKIGDDNFTFPVGKSGTGFVPIRIQDIVGATSAFTAEYIRSTPPNRTNITAAGIHHISTCEYWMLDRTTGTSTADIIAFWNANSPCDAGPYVTQASTMKLVHYNGTEWNTASPSNGTGGPGAGSVTWGDVNTFSPFALGTTSSTENPLPVVFADVKAYAQNNGIQIEWSNLTEKDVAAYTVERSVNGKDFSGIAEQLPTSNQNDKASYNAFDATPANSVNFYRIKAIETTGKIVYSKVLSVNLGQTGQSLKLYPNPVSGNQVSINLSNIKRGQYNLRVVSAAGQDVYKQVINSHGSTLTQTLDLPSSFKPGVYNMIITGSDYRESKMFILK